MSGTAVCRLWRGWTTPDNADAYEHVVRGEVIPGIEAREIPGFRHIDLMRRDLGDDGSAARARTAPHPGGDEGHVEAFEHLLVERRFLPNAPAHKHSEAVESHHLTVGAVFKTLSVKAPPTFR